MQDTDTSLPIEPVKYVKAQLEMRKRQQEQVARAQETIEDELEDKQGRLSIVDMELQLQNKTTSPEKETLAKDVAELERKLQLFKDGCKATTREIDELTSYLSAIQRINRGLPKGLIKSSTEKTPGST